MSLEKEKMTAPCMSVAADKEQSIAKITNISLSEKAAKCNEEIGLPPVFVPTSELVKTVSWHPHSFLGLATW